MHNKIVKIIQIMVFIVIITITNSPYFLGGALKVYANAASYGRVTNLPLPRFVSLKGKETNMRSGPGPDHALLWIYQKQGLPVEIIDEYEHWRKIRDLDGSEGWIHQSVLSGRRTVIMLEGTHNIYMNSDTKSDVTAMVDGGTVAIPKQCTLDYCYVEHLEFQGWVEKNVLYGVYDNEIFN